MLTGRLFFKIAPRPVAPNPLRLSGVIPAVGIHTLVPGEGSPFVVAGPLIAKQLEQLIVGTGVNSFGGEAHATLNPWIN